MAVAIDQRSGLDVECVEARPWVRHFVEEYQDGRPWGYAIFEDPTIDDEKMEECMSRIDNLLRIAKDAVFGRSYEGFPHLKCEVLDWPEGVEDGDAKDQRVHAPAPGEQDGVSNGGDGGTGAEDTEEDADVDEADGEQEEDDDEEDDEDDADIEMVRELPKLRTHFKWVRDRAKKRRKTYEPQDVDRSGIPGGLLRNVFLVIDQNAIDSIVSNSPMADNAWVWAIDPNYMDDVASMTKNGLQDEYYGYMRVRVQQLVNNFWDARHYHEDDLPLPTLWEAAKQSQNCAFVSVDPEEARLFKGGMNLGSVLRPHPG